MTVKRAVKNAKDSSSATARNDHDPRVAQLIATFRADPTMAPIADAFEKAKEQPGRRFGSNGLKVNGKLFALFTQGTVVVKLSKDRVAELVDSNIGEPFDPGHGRPMKEWLTLTSSRARWIDLTKEAHDFVKGARRQR